MKKRKKDANRTIRFFITGIILIIVVLWIGNLWYEYSNEKDHKGKEVTVEIRKGAGIKEIAEVLKENKVIRNKSVFYLKVRNLNAGEKLKYGTFVMNTGNSLGTTIAELTGPGKQNTDNWFTVPEGYTIEKIGAKLEDEGKCTKKEFLKAVQKDYDYWFLKSIPEDADVVYRLQGFLFPNTYEITEKMTAEDIVRTMLDQFGAQYTKEMEKEAKKMGKTTYEIVTEASIIERETDIEKERPMIAGVIENRLKAGMPLQMCPTVLYPLTDGMYDVPTVTYEDTRIDSLYNTYQNKGLPPGPIASPGLSCLKAALHPAEHDYLFYHMDSENKEHIFTKTYEEHVDTQK